MMLPAIGLLVSAKTLSRILSWDWLSAAADISLGVTLSVTPVFSSCKLVVFSPMSRMLSTELLLISASMLFAVTTTCRNSTRTRPR